MKLKKFDGIVGWLTLIGNLYAVRRKSFDEALRETIEEGKRIMSDEFKHFLEDKVNKELYISIMNVIELCQDDEEIKREVEAYLGRINDKTPTNALESPVDSGFVEKMNDEYC